MSLHNFSYNQFLVKTQETIMIYGIVILNQNEMKISFFQLSSNSSEKLYQALQQLQAGCSNRSLKILAMKVVTLVI